jgi:hypothetical protein
MDEIDGIGHWASNTRREVYAAKIPKLVSVAVHQEDYTLLGVTWP